MKKGVRTDCNSQRALRGVLYDPESLTFCEIQRSLTSLGLISSGKKDCIIAAHSLSLSGMLQELRALDRVNTP